MGQKISLSIFLAFIIIVGVANYINDHRLKVKAPVEASDAASDAAIPSQAPPPPAVENRALFGSSYDECILKNAARGGDYASRQMALDVCARHFSRDATTAEADDIEVTEFGFKDTDESDKVHFQITNRTDQLVVRRAVLTLMYPNKDGDTLTWTRDLDLEPNHDYDFDGTFTSGRAPEGRGILVVRRFQVLDRAAPIH